MVSSRGPEPATAGAPARSRDARLSSVAAAQDGVVSYEQLLEFGYSRHEIGTLVRRRRLHRIHRGVYAVGHRRLGPHGRMWAAVLATGGVIAGRCAAHLHDLLPYSGATVQIATTTGQPRQRPGIAVRRVRDLDVAQRAGLPVTSVARTLLDLAAVQPRRRIEQAVDQAQITGVYDHRPVAALAASNRPGAPALRAALEACATPVVLRSELERVLLELVRDGNLAQPLVNHRVLGHEVDFLWPAAALVVEVDGVRYHATGRAKERDAAKDNALQLAGLRVLHYRWRRVTARPADVRAELTRALAACRLGRHDVTPAPHDP